MALFADYTRRLSPAFVLLYGWWLLMAPPAMGQTQVRTAITPDGTLGTRVTQQGNVHTIAGGRRNGTNLFHSFDRFSVGTQDTASFTGPQGIKNIVNRVTGAQPSMIDGRLRSEIAGADLYLLNPRGVLFGPQATLEVSGAFHVSTADALHFHDGSTFMARPDSVPGFITATPVAFGFLQANPGSISIAGSTLRVADGQALSIVGGQVMLSRATLTAPGGAVQIVSRGEAGRVPILATDSTSTPPGGARPRIDETTLSTAVTERGDAGTIGLHAGDIQVTGNSNSIANVTGANNPGRADYHNGHRKSDARGARHTKLHAPSE
jgi:filamentous hemagglutinin family protein